MSSRLYPRHVHGNPQLRIFLPDFWLILVKPKMPNARPNTVTFRAHPRMTENDVRNYLEKIYKLPVADVRTTIHAGEMPLGKGATYVVKKYDYRLCHVSLPIGVTFKHPGDDLFQVDGKSGDLTEMESSLKQIKAAGQKFRDRTRGAGRNMPTWWSATSD